VDTGELSSMRFGTSRLTAKKHSLLLAFCVLIAASTVLATSAAWARQPNIDIEGQGISIADGDLTPDFWAHHYSRRHSSQPAPRVSCAGPPPSDAENRKR